MMSILDALPATKTLTSTLQGGGILGGLLSDISGGEAASQAVKFEREQALINARQLEAATKIEEFRTRAQGRARVGAAEALVGASGTTRSGSAVSLIADEEFNALLNESIVKARGGQAVTGQLNRAEQLRAEAQNVETSKNIQLLIQSGQLFASLG